MGQLPYRRRYESWHMTEDSDPFNYASIGGMPCLRQLRFSSDCEADALVNTGSTTTSLAELWSVDQSKLRK